MTKFWAPGRVKTRLARSMLDHPIWVERWTNRHRPPCGGSNQIEDPEARSLTIAARLHERFVRQLLDELQDSGDFRELVGTPKEAFAIMRAIAGPNWQLVDQGTGNLGDRMRRWFSAKVAMGNGIHESAAILIGSDCPLLDRNDIEDTWDLLDGHDIVLGPAVDGGYYLIAIAGWQRPEDIATVFDGIDWSTETVLEQTLEAVQKLGWSLATLPQRRDVDTSEDLAALLEAFPPSGSGLTDRFRDDLICILDFYSQ